MAKKTSPEKENVKENDSTKVSNNDDKNEETATNKENTVNLDL